MGFAPLLFLFNKYYLLPNYDAPKTPVKKEKTVVIKVEEASAPKSELKVLSSKAAKKSTEAVLLERIQNFSKNIKEIIPSLKDEWQEEGKSLLKNLEDCQGRDFCGMQPDEDGYFDESETHARKTQVRLLEMLNQSFEESGDKKFLLDSEVLSSFLKSGNERLILQTFKQLKAKGELKSALSRISGKDSANALMLLSKSVSKEELVELIEEALQGSNGYTAVSVFEVLGKLQFDEPGFEAVLNRVCHLKNGLPQNWRAIDGLSSKIAKERGFKINAKSVCQ
tara:strand:+ start:6182 stop:7024 length:843 start_codon:yes stop_codon:yes gene_type:complete